MHNGKWAWDIGKKEEFARAVSILSDFAELHLPRAYYELNHETFCNRFFSGVSPIFVFLVTTPT